MSTDYSWTFGVFDNTVNIGAKLYSFATDTSLIVPIITGFAGALGIIAVFVVGLILDLGASILIFSEMKTFARHLLYSGDWVSSIISDHETYCKNDYVTFREAYENASLTSQFSFDDFTFLFSLGGRKRYFQRLKLNWGFRLVRPYERLWSFFISYIIVQSGSAQLSVMLDQYSLWRTARALALAIMIICTEIVAIFLYLTFDSFLFDGFGSLFKYEILLNVVPLLSLIITFIVYYFSLGTYSRLCFTLFSLVYVTHDKEMIAKKS